MASPTPGPLPLEGVKVADFSWVIAGPMLTKYLAIYGADVVKVEAHVRPDRFRLQPPFLRKPSRQSSLPFADLNPSKRSLGLDLRSPEGVEVAKRLAAWPTSWWRILVGADGVMGTRLRAAARHQPACRHAQFQPARTEGPPGVAPRHRQPAPGARRREPRHRLARPRPPRPRHPLPRHDRAVVLGDLHRRGARLPQPHRQGPAPRSVANRGNPSVLQPHHPRLHRER